MASKAGVARPGGTVADSNPVAMISALQLAEHYRPSSARSPESRGGNRAWRRRRPGQRGARAGNDRRSSIALHGGAGRRTSRPPRHWRSASWWQACCAGRDNCLYTFKAGRPCGQPPQAAVLAPATPRRSPGNRPHSSSPSTTIAAGSCQPRPARPVAQPLLRLSRRLVQFHGRHRGGSGSPQACRVWWQPPDLDHLQAMRPDSVHQAAERGLVLHRAVQHHGRRLDADRQTPGLALERGQDRVAQAASKADLVASTAEGHNRLPLSMSRRIEWDACRRVPALLRLDDGGGTPTGLT
jgi:hypothetical protein